MTNYNHPRLAVKSNVVGISTAPFQLTCPGGKIINGNKAEILKLARRFEVLTVIDRKTSVRYEIDLKTGKFAAAPVKC